jgi:Ca-activated chloride channel family protein
LIAMTDDDHDVDRLVAVLSGRGGWIGEALRAARGRTDFGAWLLLPLLPLAALAFRRGVVDALHAAGPLLLVAAWAALQPTPAAAEPRAPGWAPVAGLLAAWRDARAWQAFDAGRPADASARFADPHWRALAHYRAGDFAAAERLLRDLDSPRAAYNHGNALARLGRLAEAAGRYESVLHRQPDHADARHNLELVRRLQAAPPPTAGGAGAGKSPAAPARAAPAGSEQDAARIAEQWARQTPDKPAGLLRRKLLAEQRRRDRGEAARAW